MQGWFHCRGEEKPDALIGAGVARQQMSSQLGGGLPVEVGKREWKKNGGNWDGKWWRETVDETCTVSYNTAKNTTKLLWPTFVCIYRN